MISFEPLRRLLEEKEMSTYYLRNKCGIYNLDSKTIQRLMADESVSTNTLNSLCNILGCDLSDIAEFVPDEVEKKSAAEDFAYGTPQNAGYGQREFDGDFY